MKVAKRRKGVGITGGIVVLVVAAWALTVAKTAPEVSVSVGDRSFRFSPDPEDILLKAWIIGGYGPPGGPPWYFVYGDGRVEKRRRGAGVVESGYLTSADLMELLRLAVGSGLMEYDSEEVEKRLWETLGGSYSNSDAAGTKIELILTRYTAADGTDSGPVRKVIAAHDAFTRVRFAPDIQEYQAIVGIMETLREVTR